MNRRCFIRQASGLLVPVTFPFIGRSQVYLNNARLNNFQVTSTGGSSGPTPIMVEGFETATTGYELSGYTLSSPAPDPVYTTSPAPLKGTQSFRAVGTRYAFRTFGDQSEVWIDFMVNLNTIAGNFEILQLYNAAVSLSSTIEVGATPGSGRLRISHGLVHADTTGAMSAGTTYHVYLHYKNDGTGDIEFQTGNRTGSGNNFASVTGGSSNAAGLILYGNAGLTGGDTVMDDFEVFTSDPGNSPP